MVPRFFVATLFSISLSIFCFGCGPEDDSPDRDSPVDATNGVDAGGGADGGSGDVVTDMGVREPDTESVADTGSGSDTESGGDVGDGTAGDGILAFMEKYHQKEHEWGCKQFWGCPDDRQSIGIPGRGSYDSLEACLQADGYAKAALFSDFSLQTRQDIEDGRIELNESLADSCYAELETAVEQHPGDCSAPALYESLSDECSFDSDFYRGTSGEGEPCRTGKACSGQLDCQRPDEACGGECVAPSETGISEGESCTPGDFECADGLTCAPDPENPESATCVPEQSRGTGKLCAAATGGGLVCNEGLTCSPDLDSPDTSRCIQQESRTEGELCGSPSACGEGLVCGPKKDDSSTEVCFPEESRIEGENCSSNPHCDKGTVCRSGACQSFSIRQEGQTCDTILSSRRLAICSPGLACVREGAENPNKGTCKPPKGAGESCSNGSECTGSMFSEQTCLEGQCREIAGVGEACESAGECMLSSSCGSDGTCQPRGRESCRN